MTVIISENHENEMTALVIEYYENRIKELEVAIIEANDALQGGEGVSLLYYFNDYEWEQTSIRVIKELINDK